MIDSIRNGILSVEGAAEDPNEDFSGEEKLENEVCKGGYDFDFLPLSLP